MWKFVAGGGSLASVAALCWRARERKTKCSGYGDNSCRVEDRDGVKSTETRWDGVHRKSNIVTFKFLIPAGSSCSVNEAINKSRLLVKRAMIEQGIPGAVISVSVNGQNVWSEGLGYADVENDVHCIPETVMRIASISKCVTAVAAMQLWEDGLLDLDTPVQTYVTEFPNKSIDGEDVKISCRQLLCHTSGIRHYERALDLGEREEFEYEEYYIKDHYNSVLDSLGLFSNDDLLHNPGSKFYYTTHGWTLLSAAIEKVSGMSYLEYVKKYVSTPLNMTDTKAETNDDLIYHRSRYYVRNTLGLLENTPYVDLSYKWAGGGLCSTAVDLCKFGSSLLLSYQSTNNATLLRKYLENDSNDNNTEVAKPFILKPETVNEMWIRNFINTSLSSKSNLGYGLGWVVQKGGSQIEGSEVKHFCVGHTGAAVGASSVLVIMPNDKVDEQKTQDDPAMSLSKVAVPRGVVVAILFNLQDVRGTWNLGTKLASIFSRSLNTDHLNKDLNRGFQRPS